LNAFIWDKMTCQVSIYDLIKKMPCQVSSYDLMTKASEGYNIVIEMNAMRSSHVWGDNVVGYGKPIVLHNFQMASILVFVS